VKHEFVKIVCVCSICDFFFPFHQKPSFVRFLQKKKNNNNNNNNNKMSVLQLAVQEKIYKNNKKSTTKMQHVSNLAQTL
jgi:hypothetical protein